MVAGPADLPFILPAGGGAESMPPPLLNMTRVTRFIFAEAVVVIVYLAAVFALAALAITSGGCAQQTAYPPSKGAIGISSGTAKAESLFGLIFWDAGEWLKACGEAGKPYADAIQKKSIDGGETMKAVMKSLDQESGERATALANEQQARADLKAVKSGWPYWIGVKICVLFGVLVTCVVAWLIGLAVEAWFGAFTPVGKIAGFVARAAAFWAWPQWYAEHRKVKTALAMPAVE